MRLAISNIAWDPVDDERIVDVLHRLEIDAVDIAPGKYFPVFASATENDARRVRRWWKNRGIELTGMQALLFGTQGLNVFGDDTTQSATLTHLEHVCRIAGWLGATRLVFGSPRQRDRAGLDDASALRVAVQFFRAVGTIAAAHDVTLCLEPNPTRYGANFMLDVADTAAVVRAVDHPRVRMQLDTGAMTINGEDYDAAIVTAAPLVAHVHASEPDLVPLGTAGTNHARLGELVATHLPEQIVCVEMAKPKEPDAVPSIEAALAVAVRNYGRRS